MRLTRAPRARATRARRSVGGALSILLALALVALQVADVSCRKASPSEPDDGNGDGTGLDCSPLGTWDGTLSLNEFVFDVSYTLTVQSVSGSLFSDATLSGTGPSGEFIYFVDGSTTLTTFEFSWAGLPQVGFPYVGMVTARFDLGCASFTGTFAGESAAGDPVTGSITGLKRTSIE